MSQDLKKISQLDFIKQLEEKKKAIDKHRPLASDLENRIFQKLKLDWNYNSNAIEGNTFTHGETVALLMEGITAKGKPLKDALDIKGHNDAIQFMLDMVKGDRELNEADIRSLHKIILGSEYENPSKNSSGQIVGKKVKVGAYKTMPNHVETSTGEKHYYASPEETPAKMTELVTWFNENSKKEGVNPVVLGSIFHHRFVAIHPFDDGNGRMTRILTNFILMKFGYPIAVVKNENKQNYYATLAQADKGEILPFVEFMAETIDNSLDIYLKGINGEDINDPDDLDKEIELFRKEIGVKSKITKTKNNANVLEINFAIFSYVRGKLLKFSDLFENYSEIIQYNGLNSIYPQRTNIDFNLFKGFMPKNKEINNFSYSIDFKNRLSNQKINIKFSLTVDLKSKNYTITTNNYLIIKYYDEKIIDYKVESLLSDGVRKIMQELKN